MQTLPSPVEEGIPREMATPGTATDRDSLRQTPGVASLRRRFDTGARAAVIDAADGDRIDWLRVLPLLGLHIAGLGVFRVGVSPLALALALLLYAARMFAITAFWHRYFSHRSFRTSRPVQFAFALLGAASVQRGTLWWAAHHRHHHAQVDTDADPHSPRKGFWRSHAEPVPGG